MALSLNFFYLKVSLNKYRNKIPKLLGKNVQESWRELGVKKQTHFLLVFSTINIGFYPQKHCNRQRHHNEVKATWSLIFMSLKYIFTIFLLIFHAMCCSDIVFQRNGTLVFMPEAALNLILEDIWLSKELNLGFYMLKVLAFDRLLTKFQYFFVYVFASVCEIFGAVCLWLWN